MKANFRINHLETLPIALYFDCDAEGAARCAAIRRKAGGSFFPERTLIPVPTKIADLLEPDGSVDQRKLHRFISDQFGVPAF
jgi:hypothetical protein